MLPHNFRPRQYVDHLIGPSAVELEVTFKDAKKIYGICYYCLHLSYV